MHIFPSQFFVSLSCKHGKNKPLIFRFKVRAVLDKVSQHPPQAHKLGIDNKVNLLIHFKDTNAAFLGLKYHNSSCNVLLQ